MVGARVAVKRGGRGSNVCRKENSPDREEEGGCYLQMASGVGGAVAVRQLSASPKQVGRGA